MDHLAQVIVDATIVLGDVFSRWSDGAGNVLTTEDAGMLVSIAENALALERDHAEGFLGRQPENQAALSKRPRRRARLLQENWTISNHACRCYPNRRSRRGPATT